VQRFFGQVQDANGRSVANATITVYTSGVANPLPIIYLTTGSKTIPAAQTNPMSSDALGNFGFAAPDGTYDIVITGGGIPTKTLSYVNLFDGGISYPSPQLGTVTSVSLSAPAIFTVSGSPLTGSGTLGLTLAAQNKNLFLASDPTNNGVAPSMRAIFTADLPAFGTAGTYGSASTIPIFTTDATGRVTNPSSTAPSFNWSVITSGKPTTLAGYGITDGASINVANSWNKAQNVARVTLSGTSATPDASATNVFYLALTGNTTINNPTNLTSGCTLTIIMKQANAGGYTISYGSKFKFPGGTVQQPDATLGAISALYCQYDVDNDILLCNYGKKYS